MVGGVLDSNKNPDIGKEVINCISKVYPGVHPIRPEVGNFTILTLNRQKLLFRSLLDNA